ncbi:MAG: LPS-assembly protein LptD [Zetaproteobacteria bacterium]|nr:LPS-assembly protein LptD [Zetaproteobacteria bacterium]
MFLSTPWVQAAGIDLSADNIRQDSQNNITATGHAEAQREGETLTTDLLIYSRKDQTIHATGHVHIINANHDIYAQSAIIQTQQKTGSLTDAEVTLSTGEHIQAKHLKRLSLQELEGSDVRISMCPKGDEAWHIDAKHIQVHQQEGVIDAQHAWFYLGKLPVFYTPYWQQALRRRSGLLLPAWSTSTQRGTEFSLPYYWAPRPNWDMTVTPRQMSLRGIMGDIALRHASQYGYQKLQWSGIQDKHTKQYRQQIQADIRQSLGQQWQFNTRINQLSDRQFLIDFAQSQKLTASAYTLSNADISWRSQQADVRLSGTMQQNLRLANDRTTLQILPRLESHFSQTMGDTKLHLDQQTTRFYRITGIQGTRIMLHPWLELPLSWQNHAISTRIQAGIHQLRYQQLRVASAQKIQNIVDLSITNRMDFERINDAHRWRHTLSPIIRYDLAYAPQQTGLVNFDSGFAQLTMGNLMRGNRFTGMDRFERMNRISFLLETNLEHKSSSKSKARNILSSKVGVAYDFLRQYVDKNIQNSPLRPFSNILMGMNITPLAGIQLSGEGQFDPVGSYWSTAQAGLSLSHSQGHHINIRWHRIDPRYSIASETITSDALFTVTSRWKINAQAQYDAKLKRTQASSLGLDYQHACWSLKTEVYRTFHTGTSNKANTGVRFLIGFRGLGSIGGS